MFICLIFQLFDFEKFYGEFKDLGIDVIYCIFVNDVFVMNVWGNFQGLENVIFIFDGLGEFICKMGMLVCKDNFGFGMWFWWYVVVINNGMVEYWFEELGFLDNCEMDFYGLFFL